MSRFCELFAGSLDEVIGHLNSGAPMTLEEHRAVLANLAGKLQQLTAARVLVIPAATVCAISGCEDPIHHDATSSGAFCAVHERALREEEACNETRAS